MVLFLYWYSKRLTLRILNAWRKWDSYWSRICLSLSFSRPPIVRLLYLSALSLFTQTEIEYTVGLAPLSRKKCREKMRYSCCTKQNMQKQCENFAENWIKQPDIWWSILWATSSIFYLQCTQIVIQIDNFNFNLNLLTLLQHKYLVADAWGWLDWIEHHRCLVRRWNWFDFYLKSSNQVTTRLKCTLYTAHSK